MALSVANKLCFAKNNCGDEQKIFAYRSAVPKKARSKDERYRRAGLLIASARHDLRLSQTALALQLGVSRQRLQNWEKGVALPRPHEMERLAAELQLSVDEITKGARAAAGTGSIQDETGSVYGIVRRLPIISWSAVGELAGSPSAYVAGMAEEWTYAINVSAGCFALRVRGPSMQPRFNSGDVIVVDPTREPRPGDFVVVGRNGNGDATFNELANVDGEMWLKPLNTQFPAVPLPKDARICGVVVRRIEEF